MDTRLLFTAVLLLVMAERILELVLSIRNGRRLMARGAVEIGRGHYRWMVIVHSLFFFSCLGEVWFLDRPFIPALAWSMVLLMLATMALRYWAIATLGERWNTRVITLRGSPAVAGGPYRWIRHPNYISVFLEVLALPLVHTAWTTALVFSLANALVLRIRIRVEEEALTRDSDYEQLFGNKRRFMP